MKRPLQVLGFVAMVLVGGPGRAADKPQEIKGWGKVIDPDNDCAFTEARGKLSITVPGSLHDLFPGQRDPKKRNNAPRVLTEVKGDFVASVKVTADWKPGAALAGAATFPYNGAGLILWESDTQFVRFERNLWVPPNGIGSCYHTPLQFKEGRQINASRTGPTAFFRGRSTWLKMERSGEKLTTWISHDGKDWIETAVLPAKLPETVRIGVEAINSSSDPFTVEFEGFGIIGSQ